MIRAIVMIRMRQRSASTRVSAHEADPIQECIDALLVLLGEKEVGSGATAAGGRLVPSLAIGEGDGQLFLVAVGAGPDQRVSEGGGDDQAFGIDEVDRCDVAGVAIARSSFVAGRTGDVDGLDVPGHAGREERQRRDGQLHLVGVRRHGRVAARRRHDSRCGIDAGLPAGQNGGDDGGYHCDEGHDEQHREAVEAALDLLVLRSKGAAFIGEGGELLRSESAGSLCVQIAEALLFLGEEALFAGVPFLRHNGEALVVMGGSGSHSVCDDLGFVCRSRK